MASPPSECVPATSAQFAKTPSMIRACAVKAKEQIDGSSYRFACTAFSGFSPKQFTFKKVPSIFKEPFCDLSVCQSEKSICLPESIYSNRRPVFPRPSPFAPQKRSEGFLFCNIKLLGNVRFLPPVFQQGALPA